MYITFSRKALILTTFVFLKDSVTSLAKGALGNKANRVIGQKFFFVLFPCFLCNLHHSTSVALIQDLKQYVQHNSALVILNQIYHRFLRYVFYIFFSFKNELFFKKTLKLAGLHDYCRL